MHYLTSKSCLVRAAQPKSGLQHVNAKSLASDEVYLAMVRNAVSRATATANGSHSNSSNGSSSSNNNNGGSSDGGSADGSTVLHIFDCRPELNAAANALKGGGVERVKGAGGKEGRLATLTFLGIANIHAMRGSHKTLQDAFHDSDRYYGKLADSAWM